VVRISEEGRLGKSDHSILMIELDKNCERKKEARNGYNWRKANMEGTREELDWTNWEYETRGRNIDQVNISNKQPCAPIYQP
jgi:hypothetical protein